MTRDKIIETVFLKTEVSLIIIFGDFPNYNALCKERDAYKLLKNETKTQLRKSGIEVITPIEMKARRSVFVRRLDRHVGGHTGEEIKEELERKQEWIIDVGVIKIKDYTHVMKLKFQTVEEADRVLENGYKLCILGDLMDG